MSLIFALAGGSAALRVLTTRFIGEAYSGARVEFFDARLNTPLRLELDWSRYHTLLIAEFGDQLEAATSLEVLALSPRRPPTIALGERYFERYRARLIRDGIDAVVPVPFTKDALIKQIEAITATQMSRTNSSLAKTDTKTHTLDEFTHKQSLLESGSNLTHNQTQHNNQDARYRTMPSNALTAMRIVPLMEKARWERTGVMITPNIIPGYTIIGSAAPKSDAPVYLASQAPSGTIVVLKLLDRSLRKTPQMLAHTKWRASVVNDCNSPHVVRVIESGHDAPVPFVALEYLRGGTLEEKIKYPVEPNQALTIVAQILKGLDALHRGELVHLAIKPQNLMWRDETTLVIVDVGVAVRTGHAPLTLSSNDPGGGAYMSPEHGQGLSVDGRADLYSAGIMLFEMLTGRLPFEALSDALMLNCHLYEQVPLLPRHISHVQPLIDSLLAKSPHDRPASAPAALKILGQYFI